MKRLKLAWQALRGKPCLTPQELVAALKRYEARYGSVSTGPMDTTQMTPRGPAPL